MGELRSDQLFLGLTRVPLILGVSYMFAVINMLCSLLVFIMTSSFKVVIFTVFFHGIGYLVAVKEPLAIEIMINKAQKCSKCKNKKYYNNVESYDCF